MNRFLPLHLVGIVLCMMLTTHSAAALKPDSKLVSGRLPNGLTYYIYPNDYPKGEAVFRLFIKSGSVFEEPAQRGLAHFLEHMAFNGTTHFPNDRLIRFLESRGAKFGVDLNAHTSYNETVYKLQLPSRDPELLDSTMTILADWAGGFLLDSTEIEKERGVIFSEWLSKRGPQQEAQDTLLAELLNGSRFSERKTIGDTAVILHFPQERLREYYQNWYHPERMAVAIAGDVDVKLVKQMIAEKFGSISKPAVQSTPTYNIPEYSSVQARTYINDALKSLDFLQIQLLPLPKPSNSIAGYEQQLKQSILNQLMKSRLTRLSYENPPYNNGSVSISSFLNTSNVLLASAELVPGRSEEGIQAFVGQLEQMYRYGFVNQEITKVKKAYLAALERNVKTPKPSLSTSYMDKLYALFYRGDLPLSPETEYKLAKKTLQSLDSVAIVQLMRETIQTDKMHYLLTGFNKNNSGLPTKEDILSLVAETQRKKVEPYSMKLDVPETLLEHEPKPGKIIDSQKLEDIKAEVLTLSNGTQVVFRRSSTSKSQLTLTAFRRGGLYAMDSTWFVTGNFAAGIVGQSGAGAFSREALSLFLAGNTASVRFLIDRTRNGLAGNANLSDKESLFRLMYLKWILPRLDTLVFKQTKEKEIEAYRTANHTEEERFQRDLGYLLQGRNFTNREFTDTVLQKELTQELILPIFNEAFGSAKGYTFIITADCPLDDLKPLISQYIGGLPGGHAKTDYLFKGATIPKTRQELERRAADSPKATVTLSFQEDSIPGSLQQFDLKADIVKAVLRTKLLAKLREEMGMVYGVSVSAGSTLNPSMLSRKSISFVTMPENVGKLVDSTLVQIKRMVDNPTSFERELADVKTNLIKDQHLQEQQDSFWGSYIRNSIFNRDTDWKWIPTFDQTVNSIRTTDIAGELKRCFLDTSMIKSILYPKN
jgi:zinc protease